MSTLLQAKNITTEQISERIRSLMFRLGLRSKEALGELLGYSRTQIFLIESGDRPISDRFLAALEKAEATADAGAKSKPANEAAVRPAVFRSDAEIMGLAALVMHHSALVAAGGGPVAPEELVTALRAALEARGAIVSGD